MLTDCPKCKCPIEYTQNKALLKGILPLSGFMCYACKILIPCGAIYDYLEDIDLQKNPKSNRRDMDCVCGFKMEFITDFYIIQIGDEKVLLPGYLCQECERSQKHKWTCEVLKKIGE